MYLKTENELYRTSRFRVGRFIMVMLMIAAGIYVGYQVTGYLNTDNEPLVNPTSMPTATPSPGYFVAEADAAYWEGRIGDAIEAYQQALAMEPNQTTSYISLARLLIFYDEAERALTMAHEAIKRQPENPHALAVLCLAYDWLGIRDEAVRYCEQAVSIDPTLPEAYAYLAEAYIDNGQWFAANDAIATAIDLDAQNVDVLRGKGYVLENQGNYGEAIQAYQEALKIHDKLAYLFMAIGRNASVLGNYSMALDAFSEAINADPDNARAFDQLGWTQLLLGEYDQAKVNLSRALELDPLFSDANGHLGTLYFQQVNYEDAIAYLEPAISYGETLSRRRTVQFIITVEEQAQLGESPSGFEFAHVHFVHPEMKDHPLRGDFKSSTNQRDLEGRMRFNVTSGRYTFTLNNIPPAPENAVYIGWFMPLYTPNGKLIRTEPLFPTSDGRLAVEGTTGAVKGQPIESYYILALSYYFLDECDKAMPYINIALQIDPNDENTLKTLELCQ